MRDIRFNQGFALHRERLSALIRCIGAGQATSEEAVGTFMGVNPYMVEGHRGWLCKTGLGSATSTTYTLSSLGTLVLRYDAELSLPGTLWLLHFFLVSEHSDRSLVWHRCFNEYLSLTSSFTAEELQTFVERGLELSPSNKKGIEKDARECIKTYTDPLALGSLGILTKLDRQRVAVGHLSVPDPLIVAFVLFDSWSRLFGREDTIRLSQIVETQEMLGKVFVADASQVRNQIITLQRYGLVTYADTQHEPVTRRFQSDPLDLVERYYREQG